jgi:hypothetical protein
MRKEEYILKRKLIIGIISAALIMSLSACESSSDNSESQSINSELSKKYDFYSDSVSILKDNMNITSSQADSVFETLISIGLDDKITYCFDEKDYYKVWWGLKYVNVYMKNGIVEKILDRSTQVYPTTESTTQLETTTQEETTPQPETTIQPETTTQLETTALEPKQTQNEVVWIVNTGNKYHKDKSCSQMVEPYTISKSDAISQGYEACKKCY